MYNAYTIYIHKYQLICMGNCRVEPDTDLAGYP